MRSPVDSVRVDCGINRCCACMSPPTLVEAKDHGDLTCSDPSLIFCRLSVSHDDKHALAVPLDNRHIKLYDLACNRLANLPRRHRQVGLRACRSDLLVVQGVGVGVWV